MDLFLDCMIKKLNNVSKRLKYKKLTFKLKSVLTKNKELN